MSYEYDFTMTVRSTSTKVLNGLYKELIPADILEHFEVEEAYEPRRSLGKIFQVFKFKLKSGDKHFRILDQIVKTLANIKETKFKDSDFRVHIEYRHAIVNFKDGITLYENGDYSHNFSARHITLRKLVQKYDGRVGRLSNPYFSDVWRSIQIDPRYAVKITRKGKI